MKRHEAHPTPAASPPTFKQKKGERSSLLHIRRSTETKEMHDPGAREAAPHTPPPGTHAAALPREICTIDSLIIIICHLPTAHLQTYLRSTTTCSPLPREQYIIHMTIHMTKRRRQRQRGTPEPCHLPCRRRSRRRVRGGMKSQGWEHELCSCVASPELAEPRGGRLHEGCGLRAGSWDGLDGKGCWQAAKQAGARLWHVSLYSSKSMLKGGGGGDRRGGKPASKVVGIGRLGGQLHGRIWIFPPCIGADPRFEMMPTCRAPILPCSAPAQAPDQQFVGLACLSARFSRHLGWRERAGCLRQRPGTWPAGGGRGWWFVVALGGAGRGQGSPGVTVAELNSRARPCVLRTRLLESWESC